MIIGKQPSQKAVAPMAAIDPGEVRYIKLGPGGAYAKQCLDKGIVRLSFHEISHEAALADDVPVMRAEARAYRNTHGKASDDLRQVRDFYQLGDSTLWVTFIEGRLYWCFAEAAVQWIKPTNDAQTPYRIRRCRTPWRCTDINGEELLESQLNGALTKTASYRASICDVEAHEYLIRKINGETPPEVEAAQAARHASLRAIVGLIKLLHWRDFELLVDLVFTQSGWRRTGSTGGVQRDVDLELMLPLTGERAFIQVKSRTDQAQLNDYLDRLSGRPETRMFYVYHSAKGALVSDAEACTLVGPEDLAVLVLEAGLFDWLIRKAN